MLAKLKLAIILKQFITTSMARAFPFIMTQSVKCVIYKSPRQHVFMEYNYYYNFFQCGLHTCRL